MRWAGSAYRERTRPGAHSVEDERRDGPTELPQLTVDAVEHEVLELEDAVREHGALARDAGGRLRLR